MNILPIKTSSQNFRSKKGIKKLICKPLLILVHSLLKIAVIVLAGVEKKTNLRRKIAKSFGNFEKSSR